MKYLLLASLMLLGFVTLAVKYQRDTEEESRERIKAIPQSLPFEEGFSSLTTGTNTSGTVVSGGPINAGECAVASPDGTTWSSGACGSIGNMPYSNH